MKRISSKDQSLREQSFTLLARLPTMTGSKSSSFIMKLYQKNNNLDVLQSPSVVQTGLIHVGSKLLISGKLPFPPKRR